MEFDQSTSEVIFFSRKKNLGADFEIQPLKVKRKSKNSEKCSISRLWEPVTQKLLQDFFKLSTIPLKWILSKSTNSFQYN